MHGTDNDRAVSTTQRRGLVDVERGVGKRYLFTPNRLAREYLNVVRNSSWVPVPPYTREST